MQDRGSGLADRPRHARLTTLGAVRKVQRRGPSRDRHAGAADKVQLRWWRGGGLSRAGNLLAGRFPPLPGESWPKGMGSPAGGPILLECIASGA